MPCGRGKLHPERLIARPAKQPTVQWEVTVRSRTKAFACVVAGAAAFLVASVLSPSAEAAENSIRYTTNSTQTSMPIWWAQEHGLFKKYGLDYSDTLVSAGLVGLQSIGAGRNDASIQSDPPTCINIAKGIDAEIIAVVAKGNKSMALVAGKQYQGKTVHDLVGKKVLWMKGTGGEIGFVKYLEARGLKLSDFQQVNLPPSEAVPTLFSGGADAMWYWEPWPRKAMSLKGADFSVLARSNRAEYDLNMMLSVRRAFANENPETVKTFLRVLIEAAKQLNADPKAAAELYARKLHTSIEDARNALGDYPIDINLSGTFLKELKSICDLEGKLGAADKMPDWNKIVDPTFLRAVAPDRLRDFPY